MAQTCKRIFDGNDLVPSVKKNKNKKEIGEIILQVKLHCSPFTEARKAGRVAPAAGYRVKKNSGGATPIRLSGAIASRDSDALNTRANV